VNRRLIVYTLLTCALSWACWLPIIDRLEASPFDSSPLVMGLFLLGAYGPTLMGILLTGFYDGRRGLRALAKRAVSFKVGASWVLIAVIAGPLLYTISIAVYASLGGQLGTVNYGLLPWLPVVFIVPVVFGPLAEEFGWRGFALPLLDHKNKAMSSSIIIGFIWALWHAPLFWAETGTAISGHTIDIAAVALFFLAVIGSSFIYTWLFNSTAGSMFIAVLLHLSMNASGTITGMLFPEMSSEQKLDLYEYYVVSLWALVCLGALVRRFTRDREINGAPQRVPSGGS
jgi:uncharacterized protein